MNDKKTEKSRRWRRLPTLRTSHAPLNRFGAPHARPSFFCERLLPALRFSKHASQNVFRNVDAPASQRLVEPPLKPSALHMHATCTSASVCCWRLEVFVTGVALQHAHGRAAPGGDFLRFLPCRRGRLAGRRPPEAAAGRVFGVKKEAKTLIFNTHLQRTARICRNFAGGLPEACRRRAGGLPEACRKNGAGEGPNRKIATRERLSQRRLSGCKASDTYPPRRPQQLRRSKILIAS